MASIYSRCLVRAHALASGTAYEFPFAEGATYIIRDMDAFLPGIGGGSVQVYDDALCTFWSDQQESASSGIWLQWRGRQVFEGGQSIFVEIENLGATSAEGGDIRISGYVLS